MRRRPVEDHLHHRGDRAGRRPRGRGGPAPRPPRPGPGPAPPATPDGSTSGASRRSSATWKTPTPFEPGVAGADWVFNCAAKVGDWGTLEEFRRLNVEALRLLLDAAVAARVERFVHVSSLGVYEGRDHHGTDETVPPAANSLDAYTRSKTEAEALVLEYHRERGLPAAVVRPGFIYGERDRTVLPKLLDEPPARDVRLLRLGRAGAQLHLRQEPGPRHLPGRREPRGRRRGLQPDRRRAREQEAVRRPRRRAGGPQAADAAHPPGAGAGSSPPSSKGSPSCAGAKNPPLINKARYKFLGLNLDYSIDKARRVLGYQPPFTFDEAIERAMAEHRPRAGKPRRPRSPATNSEPFEPTILSTSTLDNRRSDSR